jgi:hypothetical protein
MGWIVNATPRPLYPGERPGTQCIWVWVGPRAGLDGAENLAPPGFDPRTVQPVASRFTDWDIPAQPGVGKAVYSTLRIRNDTILLQAILKEMALFC